jgi:hypothetical protein
MPIAAGDLSGRGVRAPRWTWAAPLVAWGLVGPERAGIVPETSLDFVAVAAVDHPGDCAPVAGVRRADHLGLEPEHVVLLALTLFMATLTLSPGGRRCCRAPCTSSSPQSSWCRGGAPPHVPRVIKGLP